MSFFAGDGKLHITQNARSIEELNSSKVYPDTTFHSDMNVICSQGEFVVQSYRAPFTVRHGDFPLDVAIQDECFEVALPQQVINALSEQQVVLVQLNTGTQEAAINFPINIKTGLQGRTTSADLDYSVAVAPQITAGGRFDVCFSYTSINNATISPNLANIGNSGRYQTSTDSYVPTKKVMPWTTNPDFPGITPNTLRAGARYAQIHFIGERWALENTTVGAYKNDLRRENPRILPLTQTAPSFVFIILNVKFINGQFTTINPFQAANKEVLLESGKVSISGKDLTSIKLLQTSNPNAVGAFSLSKSLNRVIASDVYFDVYLRQTNARCYKKYDSFIFTQGARYPNGVPLFRPATGGFAYSKTFALDSNAYNMVGDEVYKYEPMVYTPNWSDAFTKSARLLCTPLNGTTSYTYPNIYYVGYDQILMPNFAGAVSNAGLAGVNHFALIDTSKFTGLYIDKDGIKGTFNGATIPVYNNNSAPTYLIEATKNAFSPVFTITGEGSNTITQELLNVEATRTHESLLVGVNIVGGDLLRSDVSYPSISLDDGDKRIVSDDFGCDLGYDTTASTFGLVSIRDGAEVLLAHGYLDATLKFWDQNTIMGDQGPSFKYTATNSIYVAYVTISLKRSGTKLQIVTRIVMAKDRIIADNQGGEGYGEFVFNWVTAPKINVAVTKIQSSDAQQYTDVLM